MLSRVADSLYWMSRYLERAEHISRVVDVHLNLTLEDAGGRPTLERWSRLINGLHYRNVPPEATDYDLTYAFAFDASNGGSIVSCIAAARENARQIREQISSEMWTQINRLYLDVRRTRMKDVWNGQPNQFFASVKDGCHLFEGITATTLIRNEGWHFINLGRYIERTIAIIDLMAAQFGDAAAHPDEHNLSMEEYFEWLAFLKFYTAFEAYCKVNHDLRTDRIIHFLLFSPEFPHSIRFCVEQIHTALDAIAQETGLHRNSRLHRLIGRLRSTLSYDEIDDVVSDFRGYLDNISEQCSHIHSGVYDTYIYRPVDATF